MIGCNLLTGVGNLDVDDGRDAGNTVIDGAPAPSSSQNVAPKIDASSSSSSGGSIDAGTDTYVPPPVLEGDFGGHHYEVVFSHQTWSDSKTAAEAKGGHLATITSAEENEFLRKLALNAGAWNLDLGHGPWLGGYQVTVDGGTPLDGWQWVTGEAWGYTNWLDGEPNTSDGAEHWLGFYGDSDRGTWNDYPEYADENRPGFLVEYEK